VWCCSSSCYVTLSGYVVLQEFMLCNSEERDPRKCFREGKEVTRCALEFFQKVKIHCTEEFTTYWKCVDRSGYDMDLKRCGRLI